MNNKILGTLLLALALLVGACKGTRQIQTAITRVDTTAVVAIAEPKIDSAAIKADILQRVNSHKIDFQYFLGKVKIDFADDKGKNTNATAFVRIKKDELIWISLTGAMGIEGYRILVDKDSVLVMDKLGKTISPRSISYLQDVIKLPVDFKVLQDLLVGNPVFFPNNIVSFKNNANSLMALSIGDFFKHLITVDTTTNNVMHSKLDDVDELRNRTCSITMDNYSNVQGRFFSMLREITVAERTKIDIKLDFKQVVFDEVQSFPFNVPKNYTVK